MYRYSVRLERRSLGPLDPWNADRAGELRSDAVQSIVEAAMQDVCFCREDRNQEIHVRYQRGPFFWTWLDLLCWFRVLRTSLRLLEGEGVQDGQSIQLGILYWNSVISISSSS